MKSDIKFGIDVDGVLRNLVDGIIFLYNLRFGKSITRKDFVHYDVKDMFPDIPNASEYFFSGKNAEILLGMSAPIDGAIDAYHLLSGIGIVYVITSQNTYDNVNHTLQWLHKHNVDTDQICFVKDKSMITNLDYFIDDNPDKFVGCTAKHAVLIDMPYNRDIGLEKIRETCSCETVKRYLSLADFADKFIKETSIK